MNDGKVSESSRPTPPTVPTGISGQKSLWIAVGLCVAWLAIAGIFVWNFADTQETFSPPPPSRQPIVQPKSSPPELVVETEPAGAAVFLNGRPIGPSPVKIKGLKPGTYALRLERSGRDIVHKRIKMKAGGKRNTVKVNLPEESYGTVTVKLEPRGSEVWLDGTNMGHTPLTLDRVPIGMHDLVVRKTNYESWSTTFHLTKDKPIVFSGEKLEDKLFTALKRLTQSEPDNVANWADLGRYAFLTDRVEESVEAFLKGLEAASRPIDFPENFQEIDKHMRVQHRTKNIGKMQSDLKRVRSWPGKLSQIFKTSFDTKLMAKIEKNKNDWGLMNNTGQIFAKNKSYELALKVYRLYIRTQNAKMPHNPPPSLSKAYLAVLSIHLKQKNLTSLKAEAKDFLKYSRPTPNDLQQLGHKLYAEIKHTRASKRIDQLELAESLLRKAVNLAHGKKNVDIRSLCLFEHGHILVLLDKPDEAIEAYKSCIELSRHKTTKEQRMLPLADYLWKLNRRPEARAIYEKLVDSPHAIIKKKAKEKLKLLGTP